MSAALLCSAFLKSFVTVPSYTAVRTFAAPGSQVPDILKNLYIKELRDYKPSQVKVDTSDIKDLKVPSSPQPPAVENNYAVDLSGIVPDVKPTTGVKDDSPSDYFMQQLLETEAKEIAEDNARWDH